ncbi:MAG TPA: hypothetical protein VN426_02170 [Syntrophomonadaceae bacterium]|nr:hypothetical protein [Syntrophomonadaceae bacterium]
MVAVDQPSTNENNKKALKNLGIPALLKQPELLDAANRLFRIPVFLSHSSLGTLNETQLQFLIRLIQQIQKELFFPRTLPRTEAYPEDILTNVRRMMLSSYGLVAVNFGLQKVLVEQTNGAVPLPSPPNNEFWIGSAFSQIEPAMAFQYGLPMLLIIQSGVVMQGIFSFGIAPFTILTWNSDPANPKPGDINAFFNSVSWKEILKNWAAEVRNGYFIQTNPEFQYSCNGSE